MNKFKKIKIMVLSALIIAAGGVVGGYLLGQKKSNVPLPSRTQIENSTDKPDLLKTVTDGVEIITNDDGLLGYTMDRIYDASKNLTPNEQLTNQIRYSSEKATNELDIIPWCNQFENQIEEWSRKLNDESKERMRSLINLVRDIRDNNIEFRGILFNNLPFSIQEDIKSILDDMIFIYNNGYPKDRENLQEYENALRSVVDNKVIGLRQ
jgi:hypothetical protein